MIVLSESILIEFEADDLSSKAAIWYICSKPFTQPAQLLDGSLPFAQAPTNTINNTNC